MINGGDFTWDFIFDAVTQEDEDKARGESGSTILRDPGPGLTRVSGMTLTNEYTGTVMVFDESVKVVVAGTLRTESYAELDVPDLREDDRDFSVP